MKQGGMMVRKAPEFDSSKAQYNLQAMSDNPYPGRGIVIGRAPDGKATIVYWLAGRNEDSRNRHLVQRSGGDIRAEAFDPSKIKDPRLIIYPAMRRVLGSRIVTNGAQTDDIHRALWGIGRSKTPLIHAAFRTALSGWSFEPDDPATPRISGIVLPDGSYAYSIIRANTTTGGTEHTFGQGALDGIPPGNGICFHTYKSDGSPPPSFEGGPYAVPLEGTAEETAQLLWESLNPNVRVAIVAETIDLATGGTALHIINQLNQASQE